jgi:hypothetical protein
MDDVDTFSRNSRCLVVACRPSQSETTREVSRDKDQEDAERDKDCEKKKKFHDLCLV